MKSPLERFRKRLTRKAYQRRRQTEIETEEESGREMGFATCNFEAFSIVRWDFVSIFFRFFGFSSSYLFLVFFPCCFLSKRCFAGRVLRNGWLFILGYL